MPMIVFTYTTGALAPEKAKAVTSQIRESMIRHYAIKSIPDGLRAHTRMKIVELPRENYVLDSEEALPLYDVELVVPVDSVVGDEAEAFAREVTTAILTAEGAPVDEENAERIWCVFNEVPDGKWTIGRKVMGRRAVLRHVLKYQSRTARELRRQAAE